MKLEGMTSSENEIKILATKLQDIFHSFSYSTCSNIIIPLPAEGPVPVVSAWILRGHKLSPSECSAPAFGL